MTSTEIQPQTVRAYEVFGDFWFNSEPILISAHRGRVILVEFWDYTCINSRREISYIKEWNRKYEEYGLIVIGVHTPKFPFGKNPEVVQQAIQRLGITYPVVMDNEGSVASKYGSRSWPEIFLVDRHGFVRYQHSGEGNYTTTERVLQTLLYDAGADSDMPLLMEPLREEDRSGAICFRSTPELYAGYLRGSIGNVEGFSPESVVEYADPDLYMEDRIYAAGSWLNDRNSLRHGDAGNGHIIVSYHALEVNAVMKPDGEKKLEVTVSQNDQFLNDENKGDDIRFDPGGRSFLIVSEPRLYSLVKNPRYGEHVLKLTTATEGFTIYSFNFVSSVIPELVSNN